MADVLIKSTGVLLKSVGGRTNYTSDDYIINPTQEEIDEYVNTLERAKESKIANIKSKTDTLIRAGFEYNGTLFGSNDTDQANWNTLLGLKDVLSFPLLNTVKDYEGNWYTIDDLAMLHAIVATGMGHVNTYRASHKILKDQVNACTTIEQVESIQDNRV